MKLVFRLPVVALALAACTATPPDEGLAVTVEDLFGSDRLVANLTDPERGDLRFQARASLTGDRLEVARYVNGARSPERFAGTLALDLATGHARVSGELLLDGIPTALAGDLVSGSLALDGADRSLTAREAKDTEPFGNYGLLAREVEAVLESAFHDSRVLERAPAQRFLEGLDGELADAGDDFEVLERFAVLADGWPEGLLELERPAANSAGEETSPGETRTIAPGWKLIDLAATATPEDVDRALAGVPVDTERLVIDLRGSGDDLHLLRVAAWLGLGSEQLGRWNAASLHRDAANPDDGSSPVPVLELTDLLSRPPASHPGRFAVDPGAADSALEAELRLILDAETGPGGAVLAASAVEAGGASWYGELPANAGLRFSEVVLSDGYVLRLPVARHELPDGRETSAARPTIDPTVARALAPPAR